jgi:microsomal dipeptidase-like Zn-dependent dipeptidase
LNKFIEAMLNIGLQETQIRQILGQNFLRVLKSLSPDS